jgi:hypothetical protein
MAKAINSSSYIKKPKKRGLAAKTQTSKTKTSKLYKKAYRGQGR